MKRVFLGLSFLTLSLCLSAQRNSKVIGIYSTNNDFREKRLSLSLGGSPKSKILLNDFWGKYYITVKVNDSRYRIQKNSIYGYQTSSKQVYRFFNKKEMLLLNETEEILVYKRELSKCTAGRTNATSYYFSIGAEGYIQKLTIKNLKNAFPLNPKFQYLIENEFEYNTDLVRFDEYQKIYRINLLLRQSRN